MRVDPRESFFDSIADKWDGWEDLEALSGKLKGVLSELEVGSAESVLDVGCGTGNLTTVLLAHLGTDGRVMAVDISERMIQVARSKIEDPRVEWHVASAAAMPLADASCDRVLCCSVWPHFEDPIKTARELMRVLRSEGKLHVLHHIPRQKVNEIHASAGEAVRNDVLPPAEETAAVLSGLGLRVSHVEDTDLRYLVTAVKKSH